MSEYQTDETPTGQEVVTRVSKDVRPIKKRSWNPVSKILAKREENYEKARAAKRVGA